jgi:hypothetical protein
MLLWMDCQPTTVSGFTMTRISDRGHMYRSVVQKGRGRFRLSTATCCRRARTSSEGIHTTKDADGSQQRDDQKEHESTVVPSHNTLNGPAAVAGRKLLI